VISIKIVVFSPVVCCFVWMCYRHGNSYILEHLDFADHIEGDWNVIL